MRNLLLLFLNLLLVLNVYGARLSKDIKGSKDHPLIQRFPGSRITHYNENRYDERNYPLSIEKKLKISGKVTSIKYLVEKRNNTSFIEVYRNYEQALKQNNFQILGKLNIKDSRKLRKKLIREKDIDIFPRFIWAYPGVGNNYNFTLAKLSQNNKEIYLALKVESKHNRTSAWLDIVESNKINLNQIKIDINANTISEKLEQYGHISLYGILFDTGKAKIKPQSSALLNEIQTVLKNRPNLKIHIVGHTDSTGLGKSGSIKLSKMRAQAVKDYLIKNFQISEDRLKATGIGPYAPKARNKTEEGRKKNRRVELLDLSNK